MICKNLPFATGSTSNGSEPSPSQKWDDIDERRVRTHWTRKLRFHAPATVLTLWPTSGHSEKHSAGKDVTLQSIKTIQDWGYQNLISRFYAPPPFSRTLLRDFQIDINLPCQQEIGFKDIHILEPLSFRFIKICLLIEISVTTWNRLKIR